MKIKFNETNELYFLEVDDKYKFTNLHKIYSLDLKIKNDVLSLTYIHKSFSNVTKMFQFYEGYFIDRREHSISSFYNKFIFEDVHEAMEKLKKYEDLFKESKQKIIYKSPKWEYLFIPENNLYRYS
jgi:hypothetical protein